MKVKIFKTLAVIAIAFAVTACSPTGGADLVGLPAPVTKVTLLDGDVQGLSQYSGHGSPVVVAFWATTCPASPRAIGSLEEIAKELSPKGVKFIAVSLDKLENIERLKQKIQDRELHTLTHAFSGNEAYDEAFLSLKGEAIPYFVVIDGKGTIVASGYSVSVVEDYFEAS